MLSVILKGSPSEIIIPNQLGLNSPLDTNSFPLLTSSKNSPVEISGSNTARESLNPCMITHPDLTEVSRLATSEATSYPKTSIILGCKALTFELVYLYDLDDVKFSINIIGVPTRRLSLFK